MKSIIAFCTLFLFVQASVSAQSVFDDLLTKEWAGSGELLGSKTGFRMKWSKTLNEKFFMLNYETTRSSGEDVIKFQAIGMYQLLEDSVKGYWFDSRGIQIPLKGWIEENKLTILWGTPDTEEGKTTYEKTGPDTFQVDDFVKREGNYMLFGSASYEE